MATAQIPTFPKNLVRVLRDAYKLNQTQLAERIGVTQGAIARWENKDDENAPSGPAAILLQQMANRKKITQ